MLSNVAIQILTDFKGTLPTRYQLGRGNKMEKCISPRILNFGQIISWYWRSIDSKTNSYHPIILSGPNISGTISPTDRNPRNISRLLDQIK